MTLVRRARDAAGAAAAGAVAAAVVAWLILLVAALVVAVATGGSGTGQLTDVFGGEFGSALAGLVLFGPNVLLALFALGLGVPFTADLGVLASAPEASGSARPGSVSLLAAAGQEPWLWLLPVVAAAALITGGTVAALLAPDLRIARRRCWNLGLATAAVLCAVSVATPISADSDTAGASSVIAGAHLAPLLAVVLGLIWGTAAGWLGALLAPTLPPALAEIVRRIGPAHPGATSLPLESSGGR